MINGKRFTDIAMSYQGFTCTDNKSNRIMVRQVGRYIAVLVALNPSVSLTPLMDEVMQKIESNP
jgi:shikimate kinase